MTALLSGSPLVGGSPRYRALSGAALLVLAGVVMGLGACRESKPVVAESAQDTFPGGKLTAGNETVGNATAGNDTAGNATAGNDTAGNATAGNEAKKGVSEPLPVTKPGRGTSNRLFGPSEKVVWPKIHGSHGEGPPALRSGRALRRSDCVPVKGVRNAKELVTFLSARDGDRPVWPMFFDLDPVSWRGLKPFTLTLPWTQDLALALSCHPLAGQEEERLAGMVTWEARLSLVKQISGKTVEVASLPLFRDVIRERRRQQEPNVDVSVDTLEEENIDLPLILHYETAIQDGYQFALVPITNDWHAASGGWHSDLFIYAMPADSAGPVRQVAAAMEFDLYHHGGATCSDLRGLGLYFGGVEKGQLSARTVTWEAEEGNGCYGVGDNFVPRTISAAYNIEYEYDTPTSDMPNCFEKSIDLDLDGWVMPLSQVNCIRLRENSGFIDLTSNTPTLLVDYEIEPSEPTNSSIIIAIFSGVGGKNDTYDLDSQTARSKKGPQDSPDNQTGDEAAADGEPSDHLSGSLVAIVYHVSQPGAPLEPEACLVLDDAKLWPGDRPKSPKCLSCAAAELLPEGE